MSENYARLIERVSLNSLECGSYKIKIVRYGTETITCLGPKTWSIIPDEIRESASSETFRQKIKSWKPDGCPCCICKKYIANVGFVNLSCIPLG